MYTFLMILAGVWVSSSFLLVWTLCRAASDTNVPPVDDPAWADYWDDEDFQY